MNLDPFILLLVIAGTVLLAGVCLIAVSGIWERLLLVGMFLGLCFYNGVGAAYVDVPHYYIVYYFGFLCTFAYAFLFFKVAFVHLSFRSGCLLRRNLSNIDRRLSWSLVIWIYLILHFLPLIYPEFNLHQIFSPPLPDIAAYSTRIWHPLEVSVFLKLVEYVLILMIPFFYIALFRYRKHFSIIILIIILLIYLKYIANHYIGRGDILEALTTIWLTFWVTRPTKRRSLMIITLILSPFVLILAYYYSEVRLGVAPSNVDPKEAIMLMLESETSFPRNVGTPVIESEARADLIDYVKWIITLPLPKLLTGEIKGARINREISELVLGVAVGERGYYGILPGLVAESIYIYGHYFFWLHAVFIAFLLALMIRLIEKTPQLLFLQAYIVVVFAYHLNRGGISGTLPILVNQFLMFYVFVFISIFGLIKKSRLEIE